MSVARVERSEPRDEAARLTTDFASRLLVAMNDIKEIRALKEGNLQIDFPEIVLTQDIADRPKTYKGPGTISQNELAMLVFKIFIISFENTHAFLDLKDFMSVRSGSIYKADDFFTLRAKGYDGATWIAKRVLPQVSWHSPGALAQGSLETLSLSGCLAGDRTNGPNYLRMHFFSDVNVPCTKYKMQDAGRPTERNFADFDTMGCHFEISRLAGEFVVEVSSPSPLPTFFDARILEGLQFVFARSLRCRFLVSREGDGGATTRLASPKITSKSRLEPPIGGAQLDSAHFTWNLFKRYLEFVTAHAISDFWHPCSGYLHDACEASANSIDVWALGLCVAVEGVTTLIPIEVLSDIEKKEVRKIQRLVKLWTQCRKWPAALRNRAIGLMSQLSNACPGPIGAPRNARQD